jgi:phosphoglycolate phosphatase-like HAD superfamily hydrolase
VTSAAARTPIAAIVFDFDGVILESADVKTDAFTELFAAHGPDVQAQVKAHHLANMGISRFVKFAWIYDNLLRQPLSETDSAALGEKFSALALDKVLAAPFVPGADTALAALVARFPLFVASGTPQGELDLIVDRRGLRGSFREVHGTPREKPAILTDLLARHQLDPSQVLFVGDGLSDYKAAAATGVEFLARDTPALHDQWAALGVVRRPDLTDLVAVVEAW